MRLLATIVLCCTCAWADAEEGIPNASAVQKLIESLGSPDYRERERADKLLAAEGDRILPRLKVGRAKSESPEAQRRLESLIDTLNARRLLRPSLVSVDCTDASVKAVLADICKQAGYKLIDAGGEDHTITLKRTAVPFWEAMGAVENLSGFTILPQDDVHKTIYAYPNDAVSPHTCVAGPIKFVASSIGSNRAVQLANIPRRGQLSDPEFIGLGVQLYSEPKLPIVGIGTVTLVNATDDKGHSLIPPATDESRRAVRSYVPTNYRSLNHSCTVDLVRGHRYATAIRDLEGKVAVAILVEERPEITVEKLLDAKSKKYSGTTLDLTIDELQETMGTLALKVTFRLRDGEKDTSNAFGTAVQRLVVLDDNGARLNASGLLEQVNGPGTLTVRLDFSPRSGEKVGKPAKLILNEWITETRPIAFKFKNVPLP